MLNLTQSKDDFSLVEPKRVRLRHAPIRHGELECEVVPESDALGGLPILRCDAEFVAAIRLALRERVEEGAFKLAASCRVVIGVDKKGERLLALGVRFL